MKRRILCFVLTMAMVLSMLVVVPAVTVSADTYNASDNPVRITTLADMRAFRDAVNNGTNFAGKTIQLEADLSLGDFTPICNQSGKSFAGTFDGQGHTLTYNQVFGSDKDGNVGLFGDVTTGGYNTVIKNLHVAGTLTNSKVLQWTGAVVSNARGGGSLTIQNVWSSVDITCTGSAQKMKGVGGIFGCISGNANAGTITINIDSCVYSGTITTATDGANVIWVGGIAGGTAQPNSNKTLNVSNCLVTGTINIRSTSQIGGANYIDSNGGIVGFTKATDGSGSNYLYYTIRDCVFAGVMQFNNKSSNTDHGLILGETSNGTYVKQARVYNCYYRTKADGAVVGNSAEFGAVGYNAGNVISSADLATVVGKTNAEIKALTSSTAAFTDNSKWEFGESTDFPYPATIYTMFVENAIPGAFDDMSASEFVITTADEMMEFASLVNGGTTFSGKTVKLGADINLSGKTWVSIGKSRNNGTTTFRGTFDGQGHTISNMTSTVTNGDGEGGLFGYVVYSATIKNFKLTGTITANATSSGDRGYYGTVIGCVFQETATITLQNIWSSVNIKANNPSAGRHYAIGGLVGWIRNTSGTFTLNIDSCVYDGDMDISGQASCVGGILGGTNNNSTGRTVNINITNTVCAAAIHLNNIYSSDCSALIGYIKGNGTNSTGTVNVALTDVISTGTFYFYTSDNRAWNPASMMYGGIITSEATGDYAYVTATNLYYRTYNIPTGTGSDVETPATTWAETGLYLNSPAHATTTGGAKMTKKAMSTDLTTESFTESSKWNKTEEYIPCPKSIVDTFGLPDSLYVENTEVYIGTAEALNALATAVNGGKTYEGKTVYITADITIESGWTSIGETSSKPFMGNFNGQGHTIEIHQTLSNPDGVGGLISFVRTPVGGTCTIQNLHLTGRIDATNTNTGSGCFGGLISCVDGNTSGSGGTVNITNVWNSVYINCGLNNMWTGVGGMIGFIRHADGLKSLTVNFDSCVWDGTLNVGPAAYYFGGYVGYTGNNKANRTLTINIENSVAAGTIALNIDWNQTAGLLVGYAKGNYSDAETAKVTINVENVVSNGKMTFKTGTPGSGSKIGHIGSIDGTTELNMTSLYYNSFTRGVMEGKAPALAEGTANTETTVEAKTAVGFSALTTAQFTDASKWNKTTGYIVCPAGIVSTFGEISSKLVSNDSGVYSIGTAAALIEFRNEVNAGTTYAGETVVLTADIDLEGIDWVSIGVPGGTNSSGCKSFQGTFDGQGHTISNMTTFLEPTSGYVDMQGGLFSSLGDGAVVKNFTLTGTYRIHNISTSTGTTDYFGSVANAVKGTVLIQNVHSSVNITTSVSKNSNNAWPGYVERVAGIVGFIYHNCSANLTIDGCTYSGTINVGNQAVDYAGIMAHTGTNSNGSTKVVTIQNCAFTGRMTLNENYAYAMQGVAGIISHVTGNATVNISNTYSAGKIYFNSKNNWPIVDGDGNPIKMGQILGYNEDGTTVNIASTVTYVPAKLNRTSGDDSTRYILPEAGRLNGVYAADTPAGLENMEIYAEARNESTYKGIRFVATISSGNCSGAGTSAATFGIYIMTKDMYDLFRNALTTENLEAAKAVTAKVTQVKATKYKTSDSGCVVSAVVYGFDTASDKSGELVAIPYAGSKLGDALVTTYNAVFN